MDELEDMARRIAAHKMGLVKDVTGRNLPDELWRQAVPAAERELRTLAEDQDYT